MANTERTAKRSQHMDEYPRIAEHGLIGDLQTAALVTTDGTLDWLCLPRCAHPTA
jgi:hypothetical protein